MPAKKILLVDDEPLIRRSLEKTLLRAGFDIETAANVEEGLEIFDRGEISPTPFDLAVLDINMPDLSGIERSGAGLDLLTMLKERRESLPVIMLTAYDEVTKAKESVSRGAVDYFVKGREQGLVELIIKTLKDA